MSLSVILGTYKNLLVTKKGNENKTKIAQGPSLEPFFHHLHLLQVPCCLFLVVMGGLILSVHPRLSHPHSPCKQLLVAVVGVLCHHPTHNPPYEQWLIGLGHMPSRSPLSPHCRASFLIPPPPILAIVVPIFPSCCCCWPPCLLLSCPGVARHCGPAIPLLSRPSFIVAPPVIVPCSYSHCCCPCCGH